MKRRPERDQAKEIWEKSNGKKPLRELAEELGVSYDLIRKWKREDAWKAKKPRGAPKGNKNAAGKTSGAPKGHQYNKGKKNAMTHGAYATPDPTDFTAEDLANIKASSLQSVLLESLLMRLERIQRRIAEVEAMEADRFVTGGIDGKAPITYWDSKDKWLITLNDQEQKTMNKILEVYKQISSRESTEMHVAISREQLELARQKAIGIFDVDPAKIDN